MSLILQLDIAGNPSSWISHKDAISLVATDRVIATLGDSEIIYHGGFSRALNKQSKVSISTILLTKERVMGKRLNKDYEPPFSNKGLFARDRHTCLYCGNDFVPSKLTRDHIVPKSRSRDNSWGNSATSCFSCNNKKDNRTPEEWGRLLLAVPYTPNFAEHLYLMNSKRIKADQFEFLKLRFTKDSRFC